MRKILFISVVIFTAWCTESISGEFRNIFSFTYLDYSYGEGARVYENALIARLSPSTSILGRAYHDNRSGWNNTIITMGPIFNLDKYHYIELTYGYGRDSDDRTADYFAVELTREKPRYLVGMGFRHSVYPGYSYTIFSPSARYYVTSRFSLWGKYFGSMDSEDNFDHAYWFDCGYKVTQRTAIKVGFTGGNRIYSPEYEYALGGRADMSFSSILAHYSFAFTEKFVCKYQFENLTRQSKYHDIKNTIIIDARF